MTVGIYPSNHIDARMARAERYFFAPPSENINMRVSDTIRKSTLFIGIRDEAGEINYGGTAFLVMVPGEQHNGSFAYLVTAKHVLDQIKKESADGSFVVRANLVNGQSIIFNADIDHWFYHEDKDVDVAVSIFAPPPDVENLDTRFIPIENFLTESDIKNYGIGSGDEVFMGGLFVKAAGELQNMPIVRMGNIALMPKEKIPHGYKLIDAYLIEGRSIGGLSGSPAFVSATVKIAMPPSNPQKFYFAPGQSFFLGLVRGHWDVPPKLSLVEAEKVNMGISVVVPANKIKDILYQPEQIELRKRMEEENIKKDESGALDVDFSKQFTKQDFEAALNKVSRKTTIKGKA